MSATGRGLHGRVLDTLGPEITAGEYPPGSVLRTDELAQRFDVSRSVMREVVRVLESMHLVESRRRVGVTVLPTCEWNVYDPQVIRWRLAGADRPRQLSCRRPGQGREELVRQTLQLEGKARGIRVRLRELGSFTCSHGTCRR